MEEDLWSKRIRAKIALVQHFQSKGNMDTVSLTSACISCLFVMLKSRVRYEKLELFVCVEN